MIRRLLVAAMSCLAVFVTLPATAQSTYGCIDLAGRHRLPSIEGTHGVFYRLDPDMHMFHAFSDETVTQIAELSEALAALGTTLIYLPVPTKSLSMPDQLPPAAQDFGFDLNIATTIYDEMLRKLTLSGVLTTNIRTALRAAPEAPPSFFQTDYQMTSDGTRRMADAVTALIIATDPFAELPKSSFETRSTGTMAVESDMRNVLQRHCTVPLPLVEAETYATKRLHSGQATGNNSLLGSTQSNGVIALVGTEYTGGTTANLSGFIAEGTGLEVLEYTVDGGGAFAAISSYLTSRAFQESRPSYLVWANPIFENLAQFGDQPMRELIAAASGNCRVALPLAAGFEANSITADLRALQSGLTYTLFVDADGAQATEARFDFTGNSGQTLTRQIVRNPLQLPTGRFYIPIEGLFADGVQTVRIDLDVPFGINARVKACYD